MAPISARNCFMPGYLLMKVDIMLNYNGKLEPSPNSIHNGLLHRIPEKYGYVKV